MTTKHDIASATAEALAELGIAGVAPAEVTLDRPQRPEHGDLATNVALVVAKRAGRRPRALAEELAALLGRAQLVDVESVEVAGPGFLNFRVVPAYYHEALRVVLDEGEEDYARLDFGRGERVQVEFVSANPTGPLHVGNGWYGAYGDALARMLERCGYAVEREYYLNDTGNQIRLLGESLVARRSGEQPPEAGYQGEYLVELAHAYEGSDDPEIAGRFATERIIDQIKSTLDRLGITFDRWYSQASLEEGGRIAALIESLRRRDAVYDKDGAVWFAATSFGDQRDRVLIRSDGEPTYLTGDLAYHYDKFIGRGFDRVIDVFGADHHGQVASLRAGMAACGVDPDRLEIILGQMVSLVSGKMSKRSGNFVRFDELIDMVGPDAARLLALLSSISQSATIDLDAVQRQSMENPVYYVQYAYARIASIERVATERRVAKPDPKSTDLSTLVQPREIELVRRLIDLPEVVETATRERAPHKLTSWVRQLAGDFHSFYHDCRVLGDGVSPESTAARLLLVDAVRTGLSIGLGTLGISAPEEM